MRYTKQRKAEHVVGPPTVFAQVEALEPGTVFALIKEGTYDRYTSVPFIRIKTITDADGCSVLAINCSANVGMREDFFKGYGTHDEVKVYVNAFLDLNDE